MSFCNADINFIYRCDTVTNAVMMQYSRDFKGHLASLFLNENINLGKKYVFDIRRTSKEVYDHARRALYNSGVVDLVSHPGSGERSSPSHSPSRENGQDEGLDCGSCQQSRALQERLQKLREALLCMLCCEEEIDAAFCPCGHMVCCQTCANQLQVSLLHPCFFGLLSLFIFFRRVFTNVVIICTECHSASGIYYISNADVSTILEVVLQKEELRQKRAWKPNKFYFVFCLVLDFRLLWICIYTKSSLIILKF